VDWSIDWLIDWTWSCLLTRSGGFKRRWGGGRPFWPQNFVSACHLFPYNSTRIVYDVYDFCDKWRRGWYIFFSLSKFLDPPLLTQVVVATSLSRRLVFVECFHVQHYGDDRMSHGGPKIGTFYTPYNFVNHWPIYKLFHCQNHGKVCVLIVLSLKISPRLKCVGTLPCEMSLS